MIVPAIGLEKAMFTLIVSITAAASPAARTVPSGFDIGKSNIPTALLQEIGQANAHAAAGCKGPDSFVVVEAVCRHI